MDSGLPDVALQGRGEREAHRALDRESLVPVVLGRGEVTRGRLHGVLFDGQGPEHEMDACRCGAVAPFFEERERTLEMVSGLFVISESNEDDAPQVFGIRREHGLVGRDGLDLRQRGESLSELLAAEL